jgi:hypothetical protein
MAPISPPIRYIENILDWRLYRAAAYRVERQDYMAQHSLNEERICLKNIYICKELKRATLLRGQLCVQMEWLYEYGYISHIASLSRAYPVYCIQQHMPDRLYNVLGYPTSHRSSSGLLLAPVAFRLLLYIYICKEQQPFSLIYIGTHTQSQEPYTAAYEIIQSSPEALVNVVVIRCITPSQLVIYQH